MDRPATPKVLIADADSTSLQGASLLVQSLGYGFLGVAHAQDVLPAIRREVPDIVLQDLRMPGIHAARLVADVRLDPRTAHIPVVLFSDGQDGTTLASTAEPWGSLTKPLQRATVGPLLARLLGRPTGIQPPEGETARRIAAALRDQWNVLAAVTTHSSVLDRALGLDWDGEKAALLLGEGLLALEAGTDRLASLLHELAQSADGAASPQAS